MASLTKAINKDLFDKILPTFGNPRVHVPVWDEGQKMFLCEEYESGNGHRYYKGELVQKRDYDKTFRNEEFIRQESETMVRNYFEGVLKAQRSSMPQEQLEAQAKGIIEGCYKSFLDSDFNTRLTQILPQIEQK